MMMSQFTQFVRFCALHKWQMENDCNDDGNHESDDDDDVVELVLP